MAETQSAPSLRELSERATPGPWFAEAEKSDGSYGSGEDGGEGYDTAIIMTEAEIRYGKPGVLFESHNSTVGSISEEHDDEWFRAWDAVSEANAAFIVALVNAFRAGRLIDPTTLTEAVAAARAEGVREGMEAAAQNCEMRASVWRHHIGKPSETPVDAQIAAVFDSAAQAIRGLPTPPTTPGGRTDG